MYQRIAPIERGVIDMETGEFPATLFTDGEASDGHILDIAGAVIPERMPMFVNHDADPTMQLGSIVGAKRTDHEIKVTGQIELQGDGALGDIRRDVALMMSRGHVSQMSGKWDSEPSATKRRSDLPREHFAYSKGGGYYFGRWQAMEGSIVGLGADPRAVIGRASDVALPDHVRSFWRAFQAEQEEHGDAATLADAIERLRVAGPSVINAFGEADPSGFELYDYEGQTLLLPQSLIERLCAPAPETVATTPADAAPARVEVDASAEIRAMLDEAYREMVSDLRRENREFLLRTFGSVIR